VIFIGGGNRSRISLLTSVDYLLWQGLL